MASLRHAYVNANIIAIVIAGTSLIASCLPQRKSSMAAEATSSTLSVKGFVASSGGQPLQGADIYIDLVRSPVTSTGGDGSFKIDLDAAKLSALQSVVSGGRSTWNIYAKQAGTITLVGMSSPISLQQRDTFDVGSIVAQPAASIKGKVVLVAGNLTAVGAGVTVTIGREQINAGTDGTFTLKDLPSGALTIHAETPKYQAANETVSVVAGTDISRDEPVVLFQGSGPSAILFVQPYSPTSTNTSNPTTRSFKVKASAAAKFIRYYHSLTEMERIPQSPMITTTDPNSNVTVQVNTNGGGGGGGGDAGSLTPWREIPEVINYSFPTAGPVTLWYQAADVETKQKSDLLQVATLIDFCSGLKMTLGDGSGLTRTRKTRITLNNIPSNAVRIRIGEDVTSLTSKPWQAIASSIDFMLGVQGSSGGGGGSDPSSAQATRQVFVQIGTTAGECPVESEAILLQPFPDLNPMLVINGGQTNTPSRIVQVDIPALPPNAFEMRFTEITPPIISNTNTSVNPSSSGYITNVTPWMRAVPTTSFMFQGTGTRILSMQFRDIDGLVSSSYVAAIDVVPSQLAGFNIAFSQISSVAPIIPPPPSRYLVLQLLPPQNAIAFRYLEIVTDVTNPNMGGSSTSILSTGAASDPSEIFIMPWMNLIPIVPVYARGIGLRTFVMQYLTIDGITSTVTQSIFIDNVPPTIGDFVINSGEISTLFPTVTLNVMPPVTAVAMSATNLTLQQTTVNSSTFFVQGSSSATTTTSSNDQWLSVAPSFAFKLDSRGTQTIQMRFRDPNGTVPVPAVAHSIIYDPFPPFPSSTTPFTINNGATTTNSALVTLNITAPESTHSFRVSTDPSFSDVTEYQDIPSNNTKTSIAGVPWQVFKFNIPFILPAPGNQIVYIQYRNELGDRSAALYALINYTP